MTAGHGAASSPGWWRPTEWLLGIFGVISMFMGSFILFGGEDHHIGVITWSWRVGDIDAAWGYGLIAAGAVMVLAMAALVVGERRIRR